VVDRGEYFAPPLLSTAIEKFKFHVAKMLATGDQPLIEDCTRRKNRRKATFWGATFEDGQWVGENWLGSLWMELRDKLRRAD